MLILAAPVNQICVSTDLSFPWWSQYGYTEHLFWRRSYSKRSYSNMIYNTCPSPAPAFCLMSNFLAVIGRNSVIVYDITLVSYFLFYMYYSIPWGFPIWWLTDPLSHVQICTLSLYIEPTAHLTYALVNKTKTKWLGSPPSPVLSSVSPPQVTMTTVSPRDGEEPIFPLPHLNKGWMFQSSMG